MSRSRRLAAAGTIGVALAAAPAAVSAHAVGGTFQLPVPLWLYLAAAAMAVGASFIVTTIVSQDVDDHPYWSRALSQPVAAAVRFALRAIGLTWWYGAIGVAFLIGDISPLPAVLLWIGIWVGLPIVAALLGNPWPSLSPFRTTFAGIEGIARRLGAQRIDQGLD